MSAVGERKLATPKGHYKRPFDLFVLLVSHVVLSPVLVLLWAGISVLVWLEDRGPIYFRQDRVGRDGRVFTVLKFRSMVPDAERRGPGWTDEDDTRVTRVGRLLRRTALDELPQVLSMWKGDMSLVGPRALPTQMHKECTLLEPRFPLRLEGPPGLTGLAQTDLPRHCPPDRRLQHDLIYLAKASLWLDVKIILTSVWLTFTGKWGKGARRLKSDDI